ncbi:jg19744 [Pararge aegeria aegeria]|uniref:Jg19744 protein n=1 Tax=Pararge aegeria aegeria TaxID=348720 RepID=A0A8S4RZF7_9NEOP|nr:jg19744 [Pararge aegeria aegeria]
MEAPLPLEVEDEGRPQQTSSSGSGSSSGTGYYGHKNGCCQLLLLDKLVSVLVAWFRFYTNECRVLCTRQANKVSKPIQLRTNSF